MDSSPIIRSLHFYPVKSCRAVDLQSAYVDARGLRAGKVLDRSWMLIDANNKFISQRTEPTLARVKVELIDGPDGAPEKLRLSTEGREAIVLGSDSIGSTRQTFFIHGKEAIGHLALPEVSRWFSDFLGKSVRTVHQTEDDLRLCDPHFAQPDDTVSFADGFPYLVTAEATLEKLNKELANPVPMQRFRPNIVLGGTEPEAEYTFRTIAVGAARLELVKPGTRCIMITIDQETGAKMGAEPLVTLKRTSFLDQTFGAAHVQGSVFGENAIAIAHGKISVGDRVKVLKTKPAYNFKRTLSPLEQNADQMVRGDAVPPSNEPPSLEKRK